MHVKCCKQHSCCLQCILDEFNHKSIVQHKVKALHSSSSSSSQAASSSSNFNLFCAQYLIMLLTHLVSVALLAGLSRGADDHTEINCKGSSSCNLFAAQGDIYGIRGALATLMQDGYAQRGYAASGEYHNRCRPDSRVQADPMGRKDSVLRKYLRILPKRSLSLFRHIHSILTAG